RVRVAGTLTACARNARPEGRIDVDKIDRRGGHLREQVTGVGVREDVGEGARGTRKRGGRAGDERCERVCCRQAAAPTVSGSSRCACDGQYSRLGSGVRWHE
ncbi:MAG: hypothetical protein QOI43_2486, partial [Gaiellales bacterium]|nr:hypothetical protein [Gaiellales bacterium]